MNYTNQLDPLEMQNEAVDKIIDIDKQVQKELKSGTMADDKKITKLRFEQMLKGLYLFQDPNIIM